MNEKSSHQTLLARYVRALDANAKAELCARLGIGRTTLYDRLNHPGRMTLDQARVVCAFLEEQGNCDLDITHMMELVETEPVQPAPVVGGYGH